MRPKRTLPEELFGLSWARRLRIGIPSAALAFFLGGCLVFVAWSQTIGRFLLAAGLGLGLMWFLLRGGDPEAASGALHRRRPYLIALGAVLVGGGLVLFATGDQDLGLLLVLLGGGALMVVLLGVKEEPRASPMDGPFYGDTPPFGE